MCCEPWILPGEKLKAEQALKLLKSGVRRYYEAHYAMDGPREGQFLGLVCKCCNTWIDHGHSGDCPVAKMTAKKKEAVS